MLSAILLLGVVIAVFCVTKDPRTAGPHVAPLNSIVSHSSAAVSCGRCRPSSRPGRNIRASVAACLELEVSKLQLQDCVTKLQ
jgi:hypothetical protein